MRIKNFAGTMVVVCGFLMAVLPASASTIDWTDWTSAAVDPVNGSAQGTMPGLGITVSYTGEVEGFFSNYPSWTPSSSYVGGTVGNAPPSNYGSIQLYGSQGATDTLTFSSPVVDPILTIWSLGNGGDVASFVFNSNEPFTIEGGGPSAEFGGSSIFVCGGNPNAVCGAEGNGTVQINGTFSSITWTNPVFEGYYVFTVGAAGLGTTPVPEPSSLVLLGTGLLGLGGSLKRKFFS